MEATINGSNLNIFQIGNHFRLQLAVPTNLLGRIIGTGGHRREEIQRQTCTNLRFPDRRNSKKHSTGSSMVTITGSSRQSVVAAHDLIAAIVNDKPRDLTHFLSVPVAEQPGSIRERFELFRATVLSARAADLDLVARVRRSLSLAGFQQKADLCREGMASADEPDLVASMFAKAHRLHLTFGVLLLAGDQQRQQAADLLLECRERVVLPLLRAHFAADESQRLRIRIGGVQCMQLDPERAHVVYAQVHCDVLQQIAEQMVAVFVERGLMKCERQGRVLLHCTLINSRYRKLEQGAKTEAKEDAERDAQTEAGSGEEAEEEAEEEEEEKTRLGIHLHQRLEGQCVKVGAETEANKAVALCDAGRRKRRRFVNRRPFDASFILRQFADFDFGTVDVSEIHLSQMPGYAASDSSLSAEEEEVESAYYKADAVMTLGLD